MIDNNLKPNKFTDLVFRIDEYLKTMRAMGENAPELVDFLKDYIIKNVAERDLDEMDTKKELVKIVDALYDKIYNFKIRDIHTDGYFALVLRELFWQLSRKGFLVFYILNNIIKDDRFKLITELYKISFFTVIYPYDCGELVYTEKYTRHPSLPQEEIYKKIDEAVDQKRHIFYIQKDDSVDYLKDIFSEAENIQDRYVCIFREKSPQEEPSAHWLMGHFSGLI